MSPSPADPSPSTPSSSGQSSRKRKAAREDRGQDVSHDPALDGSGKQQPSKANKACRELLARCGSASPTAAGVSGVLADTPVVNCRKQKVGRAV